MVQYDEHNIEIALDGLNRKGLLVSNGSGTGFRSRKFLHQAVSKLQIDESELAVLCVLLLRVAQMPGEIRSEMREVKQGLADICEKFNALVN